MKHVSTFGSVCLDLGAACRIVLTSRSLFEKECDPNLKGPREG